MDYRQLASTILDKVGGKDNVKSVVHCATRLRFTLKDTTKADSDSLKKVKGVMSIVNAGGQFQVVIGPDVPQVYQEVIALGGFEAAGAVDDPAAAEEDGRSKLSKVLEAIASIFQPIIPAITGAGLIKALMALFVVLKVLDNSTQTYAILNAFADAAFYFLPILLAGSAAKRFKCNQYVAMALGGILVYPGFINLVNAAKEAGTGISFMGLPVTLASYSSSVIPIILGVWFLSIVEHFMQKISPKAIKFFSVPVVSIFVAGTVTLVVLGPIGTWVGNLIAAFFTWLNGAAGWAVPTLIGIISPLLVMTGTHYGLIPIGINNLATAGFDTVVGPGMLTSNVAQGAAGLAVALRTKNEDTRQLASSAGLTGLLGITEPVLYGVNLKFRYPLISAMIGGGVGGLYLGITGVGRYASGSPGLLVLPAYIGGEGMGNFINACIGTVIAIVVSFVACFILFGVYARKGELPAEETGIAPAPEKASAPASAPASAAAEGTKVVCAPIKGAVLPLSEVKDEVFSGETLGKGLAIEPSEGKVYAPVDGVVNIFPTCHAIQLTADNGVEILIHIGMDTVNLNGKHFTAKAANDQKVKKGDLLMEFDMDAIRKAGYPLTTPVIIANTDDYEAVEGAASGNVKPGDILINVR